MPTFNLYNQIQNHSLNTPFGVVGIVFDNFSIVRRDPRLHIHKVSDERGQIAFHYDGITTQHKLVNDASLIKLSHNCWKEM